MHATLTAKLVVDSADDAIEFYREAFDAQLLQRFTMGDAVVFAKIALFNTTLSIKDGDAADPAPADGQPGTIIEILAEDPDAVAERMLTAGADIIFPIADQPYGARAGRLRDPFGHQWLLQTPSTLTDPETQARLDAIR